MKWNKYTKKAVKTKQSQIIKRFTVQHFNPNRKSSKILQRLSPKHATCGVVQSPYLSIATERLACLNNDCGVQLGTLTQHTVGPRFESWPPWACCMRFFLHPSFHPSSLGKPLFFVLFCFVFFFCFCFVFLHLSHYHCEVLHVGL